MTSLFWIAIGLLAVVAGIAARRRLRVAAGDDLTESMIRRIEGVGSLEFDPDEPLDHEEIREEEREFWEQTWDEPEEL